MVWLDLGFSCGVGIICWFGGLDAGVGWGLISLCFCGVVFFGWVCCDFVGFRVCVLVLMLCMCLLVCSWYVVLGCLCCGCCEFGFSLVF